MSDVVLQRAPRLDIRLLPAVIISWAAALMLVYYRISLGKTWLLLVTSGLIMGFGYLGYSIYQHYCQFSQLNRDKSELVLYTFAKCITSIWAAQTIYKLIKLGIILICAITVVSVSWSLQHTVQTKQISALKSGSSTITVLLQRDVYGENGFTLPKTVAIWQTANGNFSAQALNIEFRHNPREYIAQGSQILVTGQYHAVAGRGKSAGRFVVDRWQIVHVAPGVYQLGEKIRKNLYAATAGLEIAERALILGIATGDDRLLPTADKTAMRTVSISHITAVSGSHVTLFMMIFLALGSCFTNRDGWLMVWMLVGILIILGLVAPEPAVLRASLMALLVLWARWQGYQVMMMPVLLLTVLCALWWCPSLASEYGFAFSVFSTAGLLLAVRRVKEVMSQVITPNLAIMVAVPVVAQIACLPVLILLGQGLPLYGVAANLLVVPVVLLITLGGLGAGIIYSFCPFLAQIGIWGAQLGAKWMLCVARILAQAPASILPWPSGGRGIIVGLLVIIGIYLLVRTLKLQVEWVSFMYKASRVIVFVATSYFFWAIST